jgi:hypothetical protein
MTEMPPSLPPELPPEAPGVPADEPYRRGPGAAAVFGAIALIVVGAVAALVITRSRNSGTGPATLKAGWTRRTVAAEGFSIGLPPGWTAVSTTSADDAFNTLKAANPQIATLVEKQLRTSLSSLIKLLAFDTRAPTLAEQFATNVNVVVAPAPGVPLDRFISENLAELRTTPGLSNDINSQRLTLPAGDAALVSSHLTVNAPGGAQEVAISQYLLVGGSRGYIISFSTLPSAVKTYSALFSEIARTFRIG